MNSLEVRKKILYKLMVLQNKKAEKKLSDLASIFLKEIERSKSNDKICENLELLQGFVYKVPKETIKVVGFVINKKPTRATVHKSKIGEYEGRSHKDLILKSIELLNHIRYISPKEVLKLLAQLSLSDNLEAKNKALEVVKKIAKYDYNVLTKSKIGYSIQREALDFILKWSPDEQIRHLDFIKTILHELLSSSVEGNSMADEKTLTFNFGQVDPTNFLKKIRIETVDLTYSIYKNVSNLKEKLQLSSILEEALRSPHNTGASKDVEKMIFDDATYIAKVYREMIFDKSGKIIPKNIAIAQEVEERMYWFYKPGKKAVPAMLKLREDILKDPFYQIFQPLVGRGLHYKEEAGFDEAKEEREKDISKIFESINDKNISGWQRNLNIVASQKDIVDDWKMEEFKNFLMRMSSEKPELADGILSNSLNKSLPLAEYIGSFLIGFRKTKNFVLWDKYANIITKNKNIPWVSQLCFSLSYFSKDANLSKYVRNKDLEIIRNVAGMKNDFKFLAKKKSPPEDRLFHYALFNVLGRIFLRSPQLIGNLIKKEIAQNPDYFEFYMSELSSFDNLKWVDFGRINSKTKKYLIEKIIEDPDFDWHLQGLVLNLCIGKSDCALAILKRRIDYDVELSERKRKKEASRIGREYEPIPYHFNPDFQKSIIENKILPKIIQKWVKKMDLGWSPYNWDLSHLINKIGANKSEILMPIIKKGNNNDLLRVAYAIESINGVDFDLCMKIVKKTKNKKTLSKISSVMYSTGVVSGEYGLSQAYEGKAGALKKYLDPKENSKQVIDFAQKMIDSFSKNAIEERKRADEEIQLRKIEFER